MNLMPRWMRRLRFADLIEPIHHLLFALYWVGVLIGILNMHSHAWWAIFGCGMTVPYLLLRLLLWRTYIDDGYGEDKKNGQNNRV